MQKKKKRFHFSSAADKIWNKKKWEGTPGASNPIIRKRRNGSIHHSEGGSASA